ncbi:hypothetical protein EMCRGX_G008629 [Ephydatia muelleri]
MLQVFSRVPLQQVWWFHMSVRKDLCRFLHEPPPNDSGHPSSIDIESTDFEDNLQTELDFRPFSSRIDVMANLIVHSPRSMGELNLKLPGFLAPQRYCTAKSIPYYDSSHSKDPKGCIRKKNMG